MSDPYTNMLTKVVTANSGTIVMLIIGLVFATVLGEVLRPASKRGRGRRPRWNRYHEPRPFAQPRPAAAQSRMPDAADQLRTVMSSSFTAKPLLNRSETYVLKALEPLVCELLPGWRVMAQVSLGEILKGDSVEAFNTINAKRVDFLVVDMEFRPRFVVEYQGQGHHQGTAAARDAVKKEALRRAGIGYGEVLASDSVADLRVLVTKLSPRTASASAA